MPAMIVLVTTMACAPPHGTMPPDREGANRLCFEHIKNIHPETGLEMHTVLSACVIPEEPDQYPLTSSVFLEYFPEKPPVHSTPDAGRISGGSRMEIQARAVREGVLAGESRLLERTSTQFYPAVFSMGKSLSLPACG